MLAGRCSGVANRWSDWIGGRQLRLRSKSATAKSPLGTLEATLSFKMDCKLEHFETELGRLERFVDDYQRSEPQGDTPGARRS